VKLQLHNTEKLFQTQTDMDGRDIVTGWRGSLGLNLEEIGLGNVPRFYDGKSLGLFFALL
jgi:hypothetical protein